MAIRWGNWSNGQSGSKSRLGIDRSTSTTASQVTVTIVVHLEFAGYYLNSNATLTASGGHTGTRSVSLSFSGSGTRNLGTFTQTFTRPWGSQTSRSTQFSISGSAGGNPTIGEGYTLPRRLYSAPATPSSVSASRVSDTQADVSWAVPASTSAPVSSVEIVRRSNTNNWDYSGAPTSSSRSGTMRLGGQSRGNRYQYAVRGKNRDATGPWEYSGWVYQRPLDVANVVASRSGNNIVVSWVNRDAISYAGYRVYDNGTLVGTVSAGTTSFTHTAPNPAQTHRYSVRAYYGSLQAAHVYSNTVQLLAAPLAPTNTSPNGGYAVAGGQITLSWTHNSVDGTPQAAYSIRLRKAGGTHTWLSGTNASWHTINVADYATDGESIEWEVQTKGGHANYGPYSQVASFGVASRPTVAFTAPAAGAVVEAAAVDVSFTVSRTPANYILEVWEDGALKQEIRDYTTTSPVTRRISGLNNNASYLLSLNAGSKVPSFWQSRSFTVSYPQPAPPTIEGEWDTARGSVALTVEAPTGATPEPSEISVARQDGDTWTIVASLPAPGPHAVADQEVAVNGSARYRATTGAVIGGQTVWSRPVYLDMSPIPVEADFLTFGDQVVRIRYAPGISRAPAASDLQLIDLDDGTPDPVAIFGPKERHVTAVSGMLIDEPGNPAREQAALVRELAAWKDLVLLRTIDAPPVWGVVSGVSQPREIWGGYQVSLTHTKAR